MLSVYLPQNLRVDGQAGLGRAAAFDVLDMPSVLNLQEVGLHSRPVETDVVAYEDRRPIRSAECANLVSQHMADAASNGMMTALRKRSAGLDRAAPVSRDAAGGAVDPYVRADQTAAAQAGGKRTADQASRTQPIDLATRQKPR